MKTTIDMAREVKATAYTNRHYPDRTTYTFGPEQLKAFAELVRADERALAAPVQEPVRGWWAHTSPITGSTDVQDWQLTEGDKARGWIEREIYTTPPKQPAPVEPVACVACEGNPKWGNIPCEVCGTTPPAAQPTVPDAFGTREGEHPQYIQGWNDCRAEMLKGMK